MNWHRPKKYWAKSEEFSVFGRGTLFPRQAGPLLRTKSWLRACTPSLCRCHVRQWLPRWMVVGYNHGRMVAATHQRRQLINRTRGCRDRCKLIKSLTGSCRVVSGRAAHT